MKKLKTGIITTLVILFTVLNSYGTTPTLPQRGQFVNPGWAPAYFPGVRYYYIPDIETFYDLENQDFVYLDDGQWIFSDDLPPMYSGFDLYNAYVVALDQNVYQPWMHYHLYVSNYPRFYYRNHYNKSEIANIRGFNENQRKPIMLAPGERNKMTELRKNAPSGRVAHTTRPPQKINYYGKNIGQPVKVKSQMRQNKQVNPGREKR
jgi:hypothetical protein